MRLHRTLIWGQYRVGTSDLVISKEHGQWRLRGGFQPDPEVEGARFVRRRDALAYAEAILETRGENGECRLPSLRPTGHGTYRSRAMAGSRCYEVEAWLGVWKVRRLGSDAANFVFAASLIDARVIIARWTQE